jgi:hypothetical protein
MDDIYFFQVFLKAGCPLPIIADKWEEFCYPEARPWPTTYIPRLLQWLISDPPKLKIKPHEARLCVDLTED